MMNSTLTPSEAIAIPGSISGAAIIRDLLNRIHAKLSRDCDLRDIDVYNGYGFHVSVALQLHGVYQTEVATTVAVGRIDPKLEVQQIELGSDITAAEPEVSNLERPVDPGGVVEQPPAPTPKKYTAPKWATPGSRAARGPDADEDRDDGLISK